ncbi:MAG: hypothetical protein WBE62_07035, partial [Methylocella sp.]
ENLRRRKSSPNKRFPHPTPVPETPTQLTEISGTLKVSLVRWGTGVRAEVFMGLAEEFCVRGSPLIALERVARALNLQTQGHDY